MAVRKPICHRCVIFLDANQVTPEVFGVYLKGDEGVLIQGGTRMRKILAVVASLYLLLAATPSWAKSSDCEDCHKKMTPKLVEDFNRGKMAETMTCKTCHGSSHKGVDDVDKAKLPTVATCQMCHSEQAEQYLAGKHAKGLLAIDALPFTHGQPQPYIAGQKGCGGCHTLGLVDAEARKTEDRKYYKYGMDCQNCHTRHAFSVAEAREPEACMTCHEGFDHPQWEMWSSSKHGVAYLLDREAHRGPKCQDCHMPGGDHRVRTAVGFLGLNLTTDDPEMKEYQTTILKGLGVLNEQGEFTALLDVVKAGDMVRLDKADFDAERKRITDQCEQCHGKNFVDENIKNADLMLKEANRVFAEAIEIVADLRRDGIIEVREGEGVYPQLLNFYEVDTTVEQLLYEMFMDHRMKAFQATYHINPDYATWYGYAKLKKDLTEIKELAQQMRFEAAVKADKS